MWLTGQDWVLVRGCLCCSASGRLGLPDRAGIMYKCRFRQILKTAFEAYINYGIASVCPKSLLNAKC